MKTRIEFNALLAVALLWMTMPSTTFALSLLIDVTPDDSVTGGFAFEVRIEEPMGDEVWFHVKIKEKGSKFSSHPDLSLSTVKRTVTSSSIESTRKLGRKRIKGEIQITFSVPVESLSDPDLCLNMRNYVEEEIGGEIVKRPAADIYLVRLKAFWDARDR